MLRFEEQIERVASAAFDETVTVAWHALTGAGNGDESPRPRHRTWLVAAATAMVLVLVGGLVAFVRDDPVPSAPPTASPTPTKASSPSTTADEQTTEPPSDSIDPVVASMPTSLPPDPDATHQPRSPQPAAGHLSTEAFREWVGQYSLTFSDATVELGSTGEITWSLEMSPSSVCLAGSTEDTSIGSSCNYSVDGSPLPPDARIERGSGTQPELRYEFYVFPDDIDNVELLTDGAPACEMHRFSLQPIGNAALWACEIHDTTSVPVQVAVTRGTETVVTDAASQ